MENLEYYDIPNLPMVRVYKNLLPKHAELTEVLIESEKNPDKFVYYNQWMQWNDLGLCLADGLPNHNADKLIEETNDPQALKELELVKMINDGPRIAFEHYAKDYGLDLDLEWRPDGPAYYKYDHQLPAPNIANPEFNMNYHTDYTFSMHDNPGLKPVITTTMYFNDNYQGGEMVFNLEKILSRPYLKRAEQFDESEKLDVRGIVYRPEAGDLVVFPAGHPDFMFNQDYFYFHSVNRVTGGPKYFASVFFSLVSEGTEYWREGIEEYGKDLWLWLEKRRVYNSGYKKKKVEDADHFRDN